jgi:GntR family transcriptional regulator, transcriptional repressor for pyruvate dehydrogenase complex
MTSNLARGASLSSLLISAIEDLIVRGEWRPGERVPSEPELTVRFGVSRSVVRDAIQNLAARGLIEVRHGYGMSVAQPTTAAYADAILMLLLRSSASVGDFYDARAVIESGVVVAAARRRTDADCDELLLHVEGMDAALEAGDWRSAFAEDLAFHQAVIAAANLPALTTMLAPLHSVIAASLLVPDVDDPELFDALQHRRIYEAILAQDDDAARRSMAVHFSSREDPAFEALYSTPCSDLAPLTAEIRARQMQLRERQRRE